MAKKPEEHTVHIIDRTRIIVSPKPGQIAPVYIITYATDILPPSSIQIPEAEYSLEKEKALIREDIKRRLEFKPETYKV